MSRIYQFNIDIPQIEVEATNLQEAKKLAADRLEQYSGSNDGSELLANARLELTGSYECHHEKTSTFNYRCTRGSKEGIWRKLDVTSISCKRCKKQLSETEIELP